MRRDDDQVAPVRFGEHGDDSLVGELDFGDDFSIAALRSVAVPLAMMVARWSRIRATVPGGGSAGWDVGSASSAACRACAHRCFTLGQLVEREGIEVDKASFDDGLDVNEALRDLVELEYPKVVEAVRSQSGDAQLFASLFVSPEPKVDYPLADEQVSEVVNFEVTANKMVAWEWLTGGDPQ